MLNIGIVEMHVELTFIKTVEKDIQKSLIYEPMAACKTGGPEEEEEPETLEEAWSS